MQSLTQKLKEEKGVAQKLQHGKNYIISISTNSYLICENLIYFVLLENEALYSSLEHEKKELKRRSEEQGNYESKIRALEAQIASGVRLSSMTVADTEPSGVSFFKRGKSKGNFPLCVTFMCKTLRLNINFLSVDSKFY